MSGPSVKISLRSSSGKCIRTSLAVSLREKELSKRTTSFYSPYRWIEEEGESIDVVKSAPA